MTTEYAQKAVARFATLNRLYKPIGQSSALAAVLLLFIHYIFDVGAAPDGDALNTTFSATLLLFFSLLAWSVFLLCLIAPALFVSLPKRGETLNLRVVPVNDRPVYALFFGALAAGTIAAAAILSTPSWHASTPMTFIALQLGVPAVTLFGAYPISNANWKILRANSWYFIGATLVWIVDTVVAVATLHPPSGYAQQLMDITKMLALAGFANYFFATDSRRTAILIASALILALLPTHIAEIFRTPFKFLKYGDFSASIYLKDPAFATRLQQQKCANFSFNHNVLTAEVLDSIGGEYIMRCNLRTHSVLVRIPKSDGIIVSEWVK